MSVQLGNGLQLTGGDAPWWVALAVALLSAAAAVARFAARRSARPQGERLGAVEALVESERTRRRQLEWVLEDLGVDVPWWPPDGPGPAARRRFSGRDRSSSAPAPQDFPSDDPADRFDPYSGPGPWPEDGVPLPYDAAPETEARRIPVPPLPPADREAAARHRRSPTP